MSDHELPEQVLAAAREDLAAFQPDRTPPFAALQARKRNRDLRRGSAALVVTALAVAGVAFVPSALSSGSDGGSGAVYAAPTDGATAPARGCVDTGTLRQPCLTAAVPIAVILRAPDGAAAGQVVTVTAGLSSPSGQPYVDTVDWGDGSPVYRAGLAFSCPAARPSAAQPDASPARPAAPPASDTRRLQHVYRTPGSRTITVTVVHGGCSGDVPTGGGTGRTTVRVTGQAQPGNGPVLPQAAIGLQSGSAGALVGDVRGLDYDGYVQQAVIDYGDGTSQIERKPAACQDTGSTWTGSSLHTPFRHRLQPGDYRLRLTVTSTDCHGTTRQPTTISRLIRVTASGWKDLEPPRTASQPLPYTEDCCLAEPGQ